MERPGIQRVLKDAKNGKMDIFTPAWRFLSR